MFTQLLEKQEAFKAKHGRYFQVVKSRKKNPNEKADIDMKDIPTDVIIDEHLCPNGDVGFTVCETKTVDGIEYVKSTGHGCGSHTYNWQEVTEL